MIGSDNQIINIIIFNFQQESTSGLSCFEKSDLFYQRPLELVKVGCSKVVELPRYFY